MEFSCSTQGKRRKIRTEALERTEGKESSFVSPLLVFEEQFVLPIIIFWLWNEAIRSAAECPNIRTSSSTWRDFDHGSKVRSWNECAWAARSCCERSIHR